MKQLVIFICALLLVSNVAAQNNPPGVRIAQWATSADATSQYSDDSWSALQATGEPNVGECGDSTSAWASATPSDSEVLTLKYSTPVIPTQVNIYQSFNPGAITGIDIVTVEGVAIPVRNSADPDGACPAVFSVNLPLGLPLSDSVIIYLDQTIVGDWNEIDAVELVGFARQGTQNEVSIDTDNYPQYTLISNDERGTSEQQAPELAYEGEWGRNVMCPDGEEIENGIELKIINQRPGSTYTITAIGLGSFDPVLAVEDETGDILCNDDSEDASLFTANLPTTGQVNRNNTSSQLMYTVRGTDSIDVTIVVGGFGGQSGEFLLMIEGMIATTNDGIGDRFELPITPAITASDVNPTGYMLSIVDAFDPLMFMVDAENNPVNTPEGNPLRCDDAGSVSCAGQSRPLSQSYVSRSFERTREGSNFDAMLTLPVDDQLGKTLNYIFAGFNSTGDYIVAYHFGIAEEQDD